MLEHVRTWLRGCLPLVDRVPPAELIEPRSTLSGAVPEERETSHWYLPLGEWQTDLKTWIDGKTTWKPNVLGQIRSWFEAGLTDDGRLQSMIMFNF